MHKLYNKTAFPPNSVNKQGHDSVNPCVVLKVMNYRPRAQDAIVSAMIETNRANM